MQLTSHAFTKVKYIEYQHLDNNQVKNQRLSYGSSRASEEMKYITHYIKVRWLV